MSGGDDALFGFNIVGIVPVLPSNMRILFLAIMGIDVCCMYNLCAA